MSTSPVCVLPPARAMGRAGDAAPGAGFALTSPTCARGLVLFGSASATLCHCPALCQTSRARTSASSPAGEQIAGADRLQRGGTWPIFMRIVRSLRAQTFLAAAHLKRCAYFFTHRVRSNGLRSSGKDRVK